MARSDTTRIQAICRQVAEQLRGSGIRHVNIIIGIDCSKKNELNGGSWFFGRRTMHDLGGDNNLNAYEKTISVIGNTLSSFSGQEIAACYGFGDASTSDHGVFKFFDKPRRYQEVIKSYREIIPRVQLDGPLSLAPIIEMAMTLIDGSRDEYYILIIMASGEISRDVWDNGLSQHEQRTREAVREASYLPLTIVMAGVGEGPWNAMRAFQDNPLPGCLFDNFHFLQLNKMIMMDREVEVALEFLGIIPGQIRAINQHGLLHSFHPVLDVPRRVPLSPPIPILKKRLAKISKLTGQSYFALAQQLRWLVKLLRSLALTHLRVAPRDECPVCLENPRSFCFQCGHVVC